MGDDQVRRCYFTPDERVFITRYGKHLNEMASFRDAPRGEKGRQFVQVCTGDREPASRCERLWLRVQLVCRFQKIAERSARVDLAEHDALVLSAENQRLRSKTDHLEAYIHTLQRGKADLIGGAALEGLPVGKVV